MSQYDDGEKAVLKEVQRLSLPDQSDVWPPGPPYPLGQPTKTPSSHAPPELFNAGARQTPEERQLSKSKVVSQASPPDSMVPQVSGDSLEDSLEGGLPEDFPDDLRSLSESSEEYVNTSEKLTDRLRHLDTALTLATASSTDTNAADGSARLSPGIKDGAKLRSVRLSTLVTTESIEARRDKKGSGETKLWGLEELESEQDADSDNGRGGLAKRRKSLGLRSGNQRSRAASFASRQNSEHSGIPCSTAGLSGWVGTPRGSGDCASFEVLPVWTTSGIVAMRKRAFTMRTKSLFLEVDIEKTKEEVQYQQKHWWLVHPSDVKNLMFDMMGLMLLAYDGVSIPLEVFDPEETPFRIAMAWIIRLYWTAAMGKAFITGYLKNDGAVEMRPSFIARRYSMTWLPMDLVVVLIDWAEVVVAGFRGGGFQRFGSGLRGLRMLRTVRLIRLIKAPEITSFINEQIRSEQILLVATIAKVIFIMLGVAHVLACAWFGIGRWSQADSTHSWINELKVTELDKGQQYVTSFHWSLSQFAGELTVPPQNSPERIFTVCVLFFAIIVAAWFISSVTTSMTQLQIITSHQSTQTAILRRYLVDQNISRPLALRVQRNAQHALREQKKHASEDSVELLRLISNPLLVELHFEIHGHVLFHHPFFMNYNVINPGGMRKVCHTAVSVLSLHTGDVLFRDLEVPAYKRMFFVMNGGLIYKKDNETKYVEKGDWMCEAILWTNWTHCGTVKAYTETMLLVLDAEKFQETISTFPSDHPGMYAEEFVKRLNMAGRFLTDTAIDIYEIEVMIEEAFPKEDESDEESSNEDVENDDAQQNSVSSSVEGSSQSDPNRASSARRTSGGSRPGSRVSKRNSNGSHRNSRMSTRASRMVQDKLSNFLGTPTSVNSPSRHGSKVSQTMLSGASDGSKRKSDRPKKKSTRQASVGPVKKESSSGFQHALMSVRKSFGAVFPVTKAIEKEKSRTSLESGMMSERLSDSNGDSSSWKHGFVAFWNRSKSIHSQSAPIQQVRVQHAEDPVECKSWTSLANREGQTLEMQDVVPIGQPAGSSPSSPNSCSSRVT